MVELVLHRMRHLVLVSRGIPLISRSLLLLLLTCDHHRRRFEFVNRHYLRGVQWVYLFFAAAVVFGACLSFFLDLLSVILNLNIFIVDDSLMQLAC
jgi:hypothetical protein